MRRDMDLVRDILKATAEVSHPYDALAIADSDEDKLKVAYHIGIMAEAGLVDAKVSRTCSGKPIRAYVESLTWAGNDFLDAVSNDSVWEKVKLKVADASGSATFDILKELAVAELKSLLLQ